MLCNIGNIVHYVGTKNTQSKTEHKINNSTIKLCFISLTFYLNKLF